MFREPDIPLYSSIAQSVEHAAVNRAVVGSSPTRGAHIFICVNRIYERPHGQAVKTSPFHGGNTSSNLVGVIGTSSVSVFRTFSSVG